MKNTICTAIGVVCGAISTLFGGWSAAMLALLICMGADYATGLIVAGVFHNSPKTDGGGINSFVGWKGLARKFVTWLIVLVAHEMDQLLGVNYVRDAVVIGFCANEIISIIENAGLMGLPIPSVITQAIEVLKDKEG